MTIQTEVNRLRAEEAKKRVIEYEDGKIEIVDGKQVFKEIRNRLRG
ncbi:hypothetical protein IIC38_11860 [candidate division KSB1 bacterium]|nr:hypothetical protein [candidate division KSB1 bacterium]